jgi:hypothetical protein
MSFFDDWSDGKKWAMGIISSLVVASILWLASTIFGADLDETIPGGTGWVFGGYYVIETGEFTEDGATFSITSNSNKRSREVEVGDIVRLNVTRPVVIIDFATTGSEK